MRRQDSRVLELVKKGLHDLAQPLTAMQCSLWLSSVDQPGPESFVETVSESLQQCERMILGLRMLQEQVEEAIAQGEG